MKKRITSIMTPAKKRAGLLLVAIALVLSLAAGISFAAGTPLQTASFRLLEEGMKGEEVSRLQQRLTDLGYYKGEISGVFDEETKEAVRAFQAANGLWVDGVAGADMLKTLYSTGAILGDLAAPSYRYMQQGMEGEEVSTLQARLAELGYYEGEPSGAFDGKTTKAVEDFQTANGLWSDGTAGEDTQRLLYSDTAVPENP